MSTLKTINIIHPSSTNTNIVLDASGNVGISNSTPTHLLSVNGPSFFGSNVTVGNSSVNATVFANSSGVYFGGIANNAIGFNGKTEINLNVNNSVTSNTANTATYLGAANNTGNSSGVFTNGTVNARSLSVSTSFVANSTGAYHTGTINAASYTVGSSTIANSSGVYTGIINAATHSVGTAFTANSTVVNAVSYYAGTTLIGNTTGPYGKTEGNLNVNNATTAYGKTEGNLNVNNATTAYGKTEGNLNVNSAAIVTSNTSTNTFQIGTALYSIASGNVGIGNSAPTHKLSVNGLSYFGNTVTLGPALGGNEGGEISWSAGNSSFNSWTTDVYTSAFRFFSQGAGSLGNGQVQMFSANTSHNVGLYVQGNTGIGNTAPADKLSVNGTTYLGGITTFNANLVLGSSGLSANGSFGTSGHTLHSNGTATYWAADDQGVTSVATGTGLTGGPITTTGTISLATAGAGAASYSSGISALTVDAYGRVTSVTGSAGYITGSYLPLAGGTMTGLLVGQLATTSGVSAGNDAGSMSVRGNTSVSAHMSFHRTNAYAVNMGLDTDNVFRLGGWSDGAATYRMQLSAPGGTHTFTGIVSASADHRAPIFYDSNDTNVRWDSGTFVLRSVSPTIYFRDTDHNSAMLHCNSNLFYILRGGNDTETWTQVNGVWPFYINLTNNDCTVGGDFYATLSSRATIFYDRENTAFYCDPAGGSILGGDLQFNSGYGSSRLAYGVRIWARFTGTTLTASGGVTSVTVVSGTQYRVNFNFTMVDANYSAHMTINEGATFTTRYAAICGNQATTTCDVYTYGFNPTGGFMVVR